MSEIAAPRLKAERIVPTRFHTLDGLRGFAALAVCVSHIAPMIGHFQVLRNWFAVDLFFMISGFVLCRTYEDRLSRGLSAERFMLLRYVRLYPLFAIGLAIGVSADALAILSSESPFSGIERATAIGTGLLLLPSPTPRATPEIVPLNPVGWSLLFELAINLVYAVFWRRLGVRVLVAIVLFSGGDLLWLAYHNLSFGGTGWPTFWAGFPRVSFCFFVGVLLARTAPASARLSRLAYIPILALVPLLFLPWEDRHSLDTVIMMIALPSLMFWAVRLEPRHTGIFSWLGAASYPLYAIHYPLYALLTHGLALLGKSPEAIAPWSGCTLLVVLLGLATLFERRVDAPLRRYATLYIRQRGARASQAHAIIA